MDGVASAGVVHGGAVEIATDKGPLVVVVATVLAIREAVAVVAGVSYAIILQTSH